MISRYLSSTLVKMINIVLNRQMGRLFAIICLLNSGRSRAFQCQYSLISSSRTINRLKSKDTSRRRVQNNIKGLGIAGGDGHLHHQHQNGLDSPYVEVSASSVDSNVSQKVDDSGSSSFVIPREEVTSVFRFGNGEKEKIISVYGLWGLVVAMVTTPIWLAAMALVDNFCKLFPQLDPNRSVYDLTGKIWSRNFLRLLNSYPTLSGDYQWLKSAAAAKENSSTEGEEGGEDSSTACLFVANHASWLDIPILCCVLDPVFKFIAKGELRKVPCIGHQLTGGNHILIDRTDRRSQFRTFKEGVGWLKKGVPLMAFPEGKRSDDGRLMDFKGGIFSMAVKSKVPIVPITISNAHAIMPPYAIMPIQQGAGKLSVHIHPPIATAGGLSEKELSELVREAILSKLPLDQHPLPNDSDADDNVIPNSSKAKIGTKKSEEGSKTSMPVA